MVDEVITTQAPWGPQQDPLIYGFGQARSLYDAGAPTYFPESTVAPLGSDTLDALGMYSDMARGPQDTLDAAQGQVTGTLRGDYLNPDSNPYLAAMSDAAGRQMSRRYSEAVAPGIQAQFANSGRTGSGLYANALDSSRDTLSRGLGEMNASLYGKAYGDERNRQMNALQLAPGINQAQYQPAANLLNVGQVYDDKAQQNIEDQFNRYNFNQNQSPYDHLGRYMGYIRGNYGGEGTQGRQGGGFGETLGLLGQGYGLAQELFGLG